MEKEQVEKILARLGEVEKSLSDQSVASNPKKYKELALEHSFLKKLESSAAAYFRLVETAEDARAIIADPASDDDFKELAKT
ncbi:MAG: hypothetical protein FWG05_05670, partial [Kiritimatiellaeota bacterium]|nr:hypothetical protein [Kiritimatiellota bacterium]